MKLSVVATLYQSESSIDEFCRRTMQAASQLVGEDYEIILVNDDSPDNSLDLAIDITQRNPNVSVIDLSRNFGHHRAMMTGLVHARGDRIFLIDSDLEEDPEWLRDFDSRMNEENCDVVYGVQQMRKGGRFERWTGKWFYTIFRYLTGIEIPENTVTARLMTRRYVESLVLHKEREVMIAGLWVITGFRQHPHVVHKHHSSSTTYTLRRKLSLLVNAVTSFSNAPLKAIFYVGSAILLFSAAYIAYLFAQRFFLATPVSGWTSLMASIWLLGGLIISFIGIVGIYLSKIFSETKQRPYTIIRAIHGKTEK